MIVESTEFFPVTLERTPGLHSRITLNPINGAVEIIDDDGMYTIPFACIEFMKFPSHCVLHVFPHSPSGWFSGK